MTFVAIALGSVSAYKLRFGAGCSQLDAKIATPLRGERVLFRGAFVIHSSAKNLSMQLFKIRHGSQGRLGDDGSCDDLASRKF